MSQIYLWCMTGISAAVAFSTLQRLWSERSVLSNEDLSDEDRSFAWRVVIFLIFPLVNFLDMRATIAACEYLGGYVKSWSYGLLWFKVVPAELTSEQTIAAFFSGLSIDLCLAACLLIALFFKPHPFLSTILSFSLLFILGYNLIIDPVLALAGIGGLRWQLAYFSHHNPFQTQLLIVHLLTVVAFSILLFSQRVRLRFVSLSRPKAVHQLETALAELNKQPNSTHAMCNVSLLYDRAGLRRRARNQLTELKKIAPNTLATLFLDAYLNYRKRNYKQAKQLFLEASEFPLIGNSLKANFLAASACSAFALKDPDAALNLCLRALEFDDNSLVARMVKVDIHLAQGNKEQAGQEILQAIQKGLDLDLQDKIPLDTNRVYKQICLEDKFEYGSNMK